MIQRTLRLVILVATLNLAAQEKTEPKPTSFQLEGLPLTQVEQAAVIAAKLAPGDELAHYALGSARVLRSLEVLFQDLNRHGFLQAEGVGNALRMTGTPFPKIPGSQAQPLDYAGLRKILEKFQSRLDAARPDLLLAGGGREFKLPVNLLAIRFDLTGEGKILRTLPEIGRLLRPDGDPNSGKDSKPTFGVRFDRADALWLAAYTQFLSAGCDFLLAHDFEPSFVCLGPSLFAGVKSPFPKQPSGLSWQPGVADLIAGIHQIRWDCKDPARLERCREGLLRAVELSRKMMLAVQFETDDDAEWLPNERQHGVLGIALGKEIQESWPKILDEAQALLEGRKLVPHWRLGDDEGIDLKRAFSQSQTFDLILWIQGQGALRYVRPGEVSSKQTWQELTHAFERGGFLLHLFYIN